MNTIIEWFREVEIVLSENNPDNILVLLLYTCSLGVMFSLLIIRVEVYIGVFGMQKDYVTSKHSLMMIYITCICNSSQKRNP